MLLFCSLVCFIIRINLAFIILGSVYFFLHLRFFLQKLCLPNIISICSNIIKNQRFPISHLSAYHEMGPNAQSVTLLFNTSSISLNVTKKLETCGSLGYFVWRVLYVTLIHSQDLLYGITMAFFFVWIGAGSS